ncbi:MAG: hydrogenase formation protein HypD [Dethiobacter sp.]|jgi:hydrogenase expression/formation protein HypD|nr:MAG: hydrogenase formation protein HypD [Dethiobacter sp.]
MEQGSFGYSVTNYNRLTEQLLNKVLKLGQKIAEKKGKKTKIMEVCGTHTVAFSRSGIAQLLSDVLDLRSGPGCPICVTHQQDLDYMISLSRIKEVIIVTFGDLLRVPGSFTSLEKEKAKGADVHICYSPLEAIDLAAANTQKEIVLLGIGFETTAPTIATALAQAREKGLKNFSIYSTLKLVPPALEALLHEKKFDLDGLVLPGHVSTVLGSNTFDFIAQKYALPCVVAGFEPLDLLMGLYYLLNSIMEEKAELTNAYAHIVKEKGNKTAKEIINLFFEEGETLWRGFASIPGSGLKLRTEYNDFEARSRFNNLEIPQTEVFSGCSCGDIITGKLTPFDCLLFNTSCTPLTPVGPCMVSSEGACSAYYQYRQQTQQEILLH